MGGEREREGEGRGEGGRERERGPSILPEVSRSVCGIDPVALTSRGCELVSECK